jgi:hypothetical protein
MESRLRVQRSKSRLWYILYSSTSSGSKESFNVIELPVIRSLSYHERSSEPHFDQKVLKNKTEALRNDDVATLARASLKVNLALRKATWG